VRRCERPGDRDAGRGGATDPGARGDKLPPADHSADGRLSMRTTSRATLATALTLLVAALPALAADVTGKWTATFDTQVGPQKYTFDLKADGEKLTGKAAFERMGQTGEADLLEGELVGDEVSFVETFDAMGATVRSEYKGKVKGDEIAFTRKVGDIATEQFVATRAKN